MALEQNSVTMKEQAKVVESGLVMICWLIWFGWISNNQAGRAQNIYSMLVNTSVTRPWVYVLSQHTPTEGEQINEGYQREKVNLFKLN